MKRLINNTLLKLAELDGAFIVDSRFNFYDETEQYYEVYKNPTISEIENIKESSKYNSVRGVIYEDGTIYAWDGDICHIYINKYYKDHPININTFRFCYEESKWLIDLDGMMSLDEAHEKIYNYRNILSDFGDINKKFQILDPYDIFYLNDYIKQNSLVAKNKKMFIKQSEYLHCHNCGWDNNDFLLDENGNKLGWADNMQDRKFKRLYKEQIYHSYDEFKNKNPEWICPICGKNELDID